MTERIFKISAWPVLSGLLALILASACASTPEPKPEEEVKPAEQADASGEEITPLVEEDRPGVAKSDESSKPPPSEAQPLPEPVALGEEASQLLASAAQLAESDPAGARKMVEQAARDNPRCFQCQYDIGVLLESEGKIADAARAYQKALSIHPIHLQSVINLSNLYVREGDLPRARQVVSAAVRAAPRELGLRNQLAAVLLASRKLKEAAEQAKGVLLVDERNVPAMICLAQAYYEWGKYELAERILLKAKENDDSHAVIPNRLGFVYLKMDNLTSAIASFKKAVELDPNLPEAHNNLGVLYHRAHDYTAAIEALRRAVALAPGFIEAYLNLGNALRGGKQFKEAEEAYRKALEAGPKERRALFNLGLLYLDDEIPGLGKTKRFKQAVSQLENFQRRGGRHPKLAEYLKEAKKKHERAVKDELRKKKREEEKRRKEEEARRKAAAEAKAKGQGQG
jgi:tetratricopeptide (TPR) repeat protein